jgi:hypothetical protein
MDYICFVCGMPIVGADIESRHECHEDDCPNRTDVQSDEDEDYPCDCDLPCHAECCPDCNEQQGRSREHGQ